MVVGNLISRHVTGLAREANIDRSVAWIITCHGARRLARIAPLAYKFFTRSFHRIDCDQAFWAGRRFE